MGRSSEIMKIRLAKEPDLETLGRIVERATHKMETEGIHQWDAIYPNETVLREDVEKGHLYVIEVDGPVAGMIVLNENQAPEWGAVPWACHGLALAIHRLTIDPRYQGRGLAKRLMLFAEAFAKKGGYETIRLDTFSENPISNAMYELLGYGKAGFVHFRKGLFYCYEKRI